MLEEISVRIRENFEAKDRIREEGLKISRELSENAGQLHLPFMDRTLKKQIRLLK